MPKKTKPEPQWSDYEVRHGTDGKVGIYLRAYNVRLATFNANTTSLQLRLGKLFDRAAKTEKPAEEES